MKIHNKERQSRLRHARRHRRIRAKLRGTAARPRLAVYRSLRGHAIQLIDDTAGRTLVAVAEHEVTEPIASFEGRGGKTARAFALGTLVADRALKKGISTVVFDRGGFAYHGRVRAVAEGARAGGLKF